MTLTTAAQEDFLASYPRWVRRPEMEWLQDQPQVNKWVRIHHGRR